MSPCAKPWKKESFVSTSVRAPKVLFLVPASIADNLKMSFIPLSVFRGKRLLWTSKLQSMHCLAVCRRRTETGSHSARDGEIKGYFPGKPKTLQDSSRGVTNKCRNCHSGPFIIAVFSCRDHRPVQTSLLHSK